MYPKRSIGLAVAAFLLSSCANNQHAQAHVLDQIQSEFKTCVTSAQKTQISYCAKFMFDEINQKVPASDPGKVAGLRMARDVYELFRKVEKNELSKNEIEMGWNQIVAEFQQRIAQSTAQVDAANGARQRELFESAQRILSQPYSNTQVMSCSPQQGAPRGTLVCN